MTSMSGNPVADIDKAMQLASKNYDIPILYDPIDMVQNPDDLSLMTYLSYVQKYAQTHPPKEPQVVAVAVADEPLLMASASRAKPKLKPIAFGVMIGIVDCWAEFEVAVEPVQPTVTVNKEDLNVTCTSPSGVSAPLEFTLTKGKVGLSFTPTEVGPHTLKFTFHGELVPAAQGTSDIVNVSHPVSLTHSQVAVSPATVQLGAKSVVKVIPKDRFGNVIPVAEGSPDPANEKGYAIAITSVETQEIFSLDVPPHFSKPIEFVAPVEGNYKVSVSSVGVLVGHAEFLVLPAGVLKMEAKGPGLTNAFVGEPADFQVVVTANNLPLTVALGASALKAYVAASPTIMDAAITPLDTELPIEVTEATPGVLEGHYVMSKAGKAKLKLAVLSPLVGTGVGVVVVEPTPLGVVPGTPFTVTCEIKPSGSLIRPLKFSPVLCVDTTA
eukprot:TRINITY_DN9150_c0_g2_i4.p1 TRINITY_DN9150_c0_g2~~TRINITY_DN9150_c0_g2_i4.p1  ORF type:complete len:440 (+),score=78.34 TRINITY_DN9150_c0_g2_i4:246-1565(+)